MANRYWIGGSGNWSNTAHWSATSGGTGGATVPTSADAVFFNSSSFSSTGQIVHLDAVVNCLSMNWTGSLYFPTLEGENGSHIYVNSNTTFITNMYITGSGWDFKIVTYGGTANIDFANISMQANVSVNGADSSGIINFTNGFTTTGNITIYNGTTNFSNGIVISCAKFTSNNTANTRIINMNSSSVTITDQLYFNSTNLTFSCGTSTITLSGSSSQYFAGQTYYGLILQNTVTFLDVFNCTNLTLSAGKTYSFLADSTYNVTTLNGNGSSITGNIVIKSTTSGIQSKINLTNETTKSRYDAKDINFSSAQLILAYSTNSGNNKNILFKLSFDNLYTYTQPLKYRLTLKKTDGTKITTMPEAFDIEYTASLKDTDTFCFSLPFETDGKENENLKKIYVDYLVFVEMYSPETGLVFMENNFLITKIDNKQDSNKYIKNIECSSLEIQLNRKLLKSYTGTKVLYRSQSDINSWVTSETYPTRAKFIDSGILNVICQLNPSWSIDEANIDSDIASLARYLDVDGENCLYFLLNTVQTSFMCLLYFDTITKKISAKNLTHIGTNRGFFISNHNIITSHTQEINSEDVITRYTIYGKDELTIRSVNPTGEEYVLDLSYYRNTKYMSQSLLDALTTYDSLIASKQTEFSTLLAQLNTQTSTLSTQKSELTILEADLKVLNTELNTLMATNSSLTAKKAAISAKETAITNKEAEITTSNTNITNTNNLIEALQTTILISNNFTSQQISELDPFIKDRDSTDDTITTASELYDEAKTLLAKINQPSINFDISIVDLFNIVELQTEWRKVSLGDIGSIRHDAFSNDIVQLRLIGYTHNYTNNELTLSFGNRNNLNAESMLLEDLKTTISNTTTLDIQKYKTLDYYENDKSAINSYISGTLDLGAQTATAGSNNEVTIDNRGITLSNPSDPQKMIRLMYNGAYLTTDGFATAKWALTSGGLNAEAVRGILGEFCTVYADRITVGAGGEKISDDIIASATTWNSIESAAQSYTDSVASNLQSQIDGSITTWFYAYVPTISNEPASLWTTTADKNNHLGDLFYNTSTGYAYRFALISTVYQWNRLTDTDITSALELAQSAKDTADGKRRVFVTTPTVPYDVGDLWSGGSTAPLKRCTTPKTSSGSYSASDWVVATDAVSQNGTYNSVQINSTLGVKASHTNGDYTQLSGGGLLKYVAYPTYTTSADTINQENFTINDTPEKLQGVGWEFFISPSITSNVLRINNNSSGFNGREGWARISKYITDDNTTFNFSYYTSSSSDGDASFCIDGTKYNLGRPTTITNFQTGGTVTINKGWHTFTWSQTISNCYLYIDDIIFEQNPVKLIPTGNYSVSDTGTTYNYLTYSGVGSTRNSIRVYSPNGVPNVWIQLPDEFKGKNFNITVFLQDSGSESGYAITTIKVEVVEKDIVNAKFKVRAYLGRIYYGYNTTQGNYNIQYYTGCDFAYVATV